MCTALRALVFHAACHIYQINLCWWLKVETAVKKNKSYPVRSWSQCTDGGNTITTYSSAVRDLFMFSEAESISTLSWQWIPHKFKLRWRIDLQNPMESIIFLKFFVDMPHSLSESIFILLASSASQKSLHSELPTLSPHICIAPKYMMLMNKMYKINRNLERFQSCQQLKFLTMTE